MNTQKIKEGGIYRHYKGNLYKVIKIAYTTEGKELTKESDFDDSVKLVVYREIDQGVAFDENAWLYDSDDATTWWVRPYSIFTESVIIDEKEQPRFTELSYKLTNNTDDCSLCITSPRAAAYVKQMNAPRKKKRKKSEIPVPF